MAPPRLIWTSMPPVPSARPGLARSRPAPLKLPGMAPLPLACPVLAFTVNAIINLNTHWGRYPPLGKNVVAPPAYGMPWACSFLQLGIE